MTEPDINPFPLKGYANQTATNADLANQAKELEERVLRFLDMLQERGADPRNIALARTKNEEVFMRVIRGIFKPERIKLPEDIVTETVHDVLREQGYKVEASKGE